MTAPNRESAKKYLVPLISLYRVGCCPAPTMPGFYRLFSVKLLKILSLPVTKGQSDELLKLPGTRRKSNVLRERLRLSQRLIQIGDQVC